MKSMYGFNIIKNCSLEEAWEELESKGVELLYGNEEDGVVEIFGNWDADQSMPIFLCVDKITLTTLPKIDWEAQWAAHGLDFHDGYAHIDLSHFGGNKQVIRLQSGPGFGDLSHPTTRLVLRAMSQYIHHDKAVEVVDIGCGSGVLSLAAAAMGASKVCGIDIDPEAVEHSRQNAKLNKLQKICNFYLPNDFVFSNSHAIVVMNMILSEQREAWLGLSQLHHVKGWVLTSGIREEEREQYLALARQWGWKLIDESEEEAWKGFVFKK